MYEIQRGMFYHGQTIMGDLDIKQTYMYTYIRELGKWPTFYCEMGETTFQQLGEWRLAFPLIILFSINIVSYK